MIAAVVGAMKEAAKPGGSRALDLSPDCATLQMAASDAIFGRRDGPKVAFR